MCFLTKCLMIKKTKNLRKKKLTKETRKKTYEGDEEKNLQAVFSTGPPPKSSKYNKLASLEATLVRNYDPLTHLLTYSLTGVKCRATSVAKNIACVGSCKKVFLLCHAECGMHPHASCACLHMRTIRMYPHVPHPHGQHLYQPHHLTQPIVSTTTPRVSSDSSLTSRTSPAKTSQLGTSTSPMTSLLHRQY